MKSEQYNCVQESQRVSSSQLQKVVSSNQPIWSPQRDCACGLAQQTSHTQRRYPPPLCVPLLHCQCHLFRTFMIAKSSAGAQLLLLLIPASLWVLSGVYLACYGCRVTMEERMPFLRRQ